MALKPLPRRKERTALYWPVGGGGRISGYPEAGHVALDIAGQLGTPLITPVAGIVTKVQQSAKGYGVSVRVLDPITGLEQVFAHLNNIFVNIGQRLTAGQKVGEMGDTGYSTGTHVHYEVRRPGPDVFMPGAHSTTSAVDPLAYLAGATRVPTASLLDRAPVITATPILSIATPITQSIPFGTPVPVVGTNTPKVAQPYPFGTPPMRLPEVKKAAEEEKGSLVQELTKAMGISWGRVVALGLGVLLILAGLIIASQSFREQSSEQLTRVLGAVAGAVPQGQAVKAAAGAAAAGGA